MNPMKVISTCAINSTQCLHWSLWINVRYVTLTRRDNNRTSRWRCPTSVKWRSDASANDASCATGILRNKKTPLLSKIDCVPNNVEVISPKNIFSSTLSQTIHDLRLVYQGIFKVRTNYHSKSWGARPLHGFPTSFYWECDLVSTPARPWSQLNWFAHGLPTFGSDYFI